MDNSGDGETIRQQDNHSGEWQTALRAYRNQAPGSNLASNLLSAALAPAQPNASNVSAPLDAASAPTRTTSKEATHLLHTVVLSCNKANNSPHCRQAQSGLFFAREAGFPWKSTQQQVCYKHCVLLWTAPCWPLPNPAEVRGVVSRAYWNETPEQIPNRLRCRNPDDNIIATRRIGKSASILITFASRPVPHTIKYMCVAHRCTKYREALTPAPTVGSLVTGTTCAFLQKVNSAHDETTNTRSRDPLHADIHPLWREPPYRHRLMQGQEAPASTTDIAEISATSAHDKRLYTSSAP
ncbi:hypothetical protein MRX96_042993 [Rhipicephalus microplus]